MTITCLLPSSRWVEVLYSSTRAFQLARLLASLTTGWRCCPILLVQLLIDSWCVMLQPVICDRLSFTFVIIFMSTDWTLASWPGVGLLSFSRDSVTLQPVSNFTPGLTNSLWKWFIRTSLGISPKIKLDSYLTAAQWNQSGTASTETITRCPLGEW